MGEPSSVTLISKLDASDPLYMHPSDFSSPTIVTVKLKGTENYTIWSSSMRLALHVRNKLGFIDGTTKRSETDPVLATQWDRCNSTVLTWIQNSLIEEVFLGHVFSKLASTAWQDLKETFDKKDGSIIFEMFQKINSLNQGGSSVSDYYNKMNSMWKQFDEMVQLPSCSCGASKELNDFNHMIKLFQFTMGLDPVYHSIRTNLFLRETLPSVKEAFAVVSREESHKNLSNNGKNQIVTFASKGNQFVKRKGNRNPDLKCTHCEKSGHSVDQCFELIGYPSWMKPRNNQKKKANSSIGSDIDNTKSVGTNSFTAEQVSKILSLIETKNDGSQCNNVAGTSLLCVGNNENNVNYIDVFGTEYKGNRYYSFHSVNNSLTVPGWIIDSGANQHMFLTDKGLTCLIDVSEYNIRVRHPNGTFALVSKIGNMRITDRVILYDIFVVPSYSVNLISVYKLARDNKLYVGFDDRNCYIQDLLTKKVLVTGSQLDGLYLYDGFVGSVQDSLLRFERKNTV